MSQKKLIIIAVVIALIILLGVGVWWWFFGGGREQSSGGDFDISQFSPFGLPGGGGSGTGDGGNGDGQGGGGDSGIFGDRGDRTFPQLRQISNTPTAGATFIRTSSDEEDGEESPRSNEVIVRYLERATGHVYEVDVSTMEGERITNTTIPRVHDAQWAENDTNIILRYLDNGDIKTFSATTTIPEEGGEGMLGGDFLTDNIIDFSLSKTNEEIFYLSEEGGNALGIISDLSGENRELIFDFPFTEWLTQWAESGDIFLNTKASGGALGYLYELNQSTGGLQKVLGNVLGLTSLVSNDGSRVLYSQSTEGGLLAHIYNRDDVSSRSAGINTLPEKCVWANGEIFYCGVPKRIPRALYPDEWYQGLISFTDNIWQVNARTGSVVLLIDPVEFGAGQIDVIKPFLDDNANYLFFINKNDLTLWVLELN